MTRAQRREALAWLVTTNGLGDPSGLSPGGRAAALLMLSGELPCPTHIRDPEASWALLTDRGR